MSLYRHFGVGSGVILNYREGGKLRSTCSCTYNKPSSRATASVSPETGKIDHLITKAGKHRNIRARKDLQDWLKRVGLPYHLPHKFRHGNAVYSLKNAKNVTALKAIGQNLMHANLTITDGIYGILSSIDVSNEIFGLARISNSDSNHPSDTLVSLLEQLLIQLKHQRQQLK